MHAMSPYMSSGLERLAPNAGGRDFVVGDLHGQWSSLMQALAGVSFDPQHDRLFSVGDLVDRGPDPMACLRMLRKPWFKAVLGNHERLLLAHLGYPETWLHHFHAYRYSRPWVRLLSAADREELIEDLAPRVAGLPLALRVGDGGDAFYVLHAERPGNPHPWSDRQMDKVLAVPRHALPWKLINHLTWARQRLRRASAEVVEYNPVDPVSITYVGHTIVPQIQRVQQHVYLDRGAYLTPDCPIELLQAA